MFVEWNTEADGSGTTYYPGSAYSDNSDLTLFAQWSYENVAKPFPEPVKDGYIFDGWFTEQENGDKITSIYEVKNSRTLYAHWILIQTEFTINYDACGGTGAPDNQLKEKGKPISLSSQIPTKQNNNFFGWTTEKDSTTVVYEPGDIYSSDKDIILYAVWEFNDETDTKIGDVNSDGLVNNLDRLILTRYLANWDNYPASMINMTAADVNGDGSVNNLDRLILTRYLANWEGYELTHVPDKKITVNSFVYGKSELGKDLICYELTDGNCDKTILLNFAIHGFEDDYDADGELLVETANQLIEHYKNEKTLNGCRLLIVPCANPDGLYDGYTNNGFGRCNSNGVDLNRDFDANYQTYTSVRNYTPYAFSASETRALRDLYIEYDPQIVIDFHGWLNTTIGDYELAEIFNEELGLAHQVGFTSTNCRGYFANWAHQQGALGLLVEFENTNIPTEKVINAVDRMINSEYDNGEGKYEIDARYANLMPIQGYTISTGRTTTYKDIDIPFDTVSYIEGSTDLCTVDKIYKNGWIKVTYPISSGNKTAFCKLTDFISVENAVEPYSATVASNTSVYSRQDLSEKIGSVWSTDMFYVVAKTTTATQIIYPLDSGGWKLGWISSSAIG